MLLVLEANAREVEPDMNPMTPAEWQEAVDGASGCLALEAARLYGLVTGGPKVDVARCEEILALGAELGVTPAAHATERFMDAIIGGQE